MKQRNLETIMWLRHSFETQQIEESKIIYEEIKEWINS
jgi:hypothetical protein